MGRWCLWSLIVIANGDAPRDLSRLVVPPAGSLEATGDLFESFRLVDADGVVVVAAAAWFRELAAKLAQMNQITARRNTTISLGMPGFASTASRTLTGPATVPPAQDIP